MSETPTMWEYIIDGILPQSYLTSLGKYLQTCAHVESAICSAICKMEGLEAQSRCAKRRHNELRRLEMRKLITHLSKTSKRYDDPQWQSYFKDLSTWLHQTIDTRHLAVHGCQSFDGTGFMVVAAGKNGSERTVEFSELEFLKAIENADNILRSLLQFLR